MKKLYILCGAVSLLICICCLALFLSPLLSDDRSAPLLYEEETGAPPTFPSSADSSDAVTSSPDTSNISVDVETDGQTAASEPSEIEPYFCPEELSEIMEENPDACAWLYIPGIGISYPVMQSSENDLFYLNHNSKKQYAAAGALFTEHVYNARDFEDPVTVIYGHLMKSNAMFGALQNVYSVSENMESCSLIELYLPDRKLEYRVFAALPFDKRHILYNYDFTKARIYKAFFDSVMETRVLNASFAPEYQPSYGDHVLILSTCLRGDNTQRYLVMAKRVDA